MDWRCPECGGFEIIGVDAPGLQDWSRCAITAHEQLHVEHLVEHNGDTDEMRRRLRNPALHAAILKQQVAAGVDPVE